MKVIGIIAEYNPFHNGHAYQIQKAKELSGADYVIVVMSGNYVQRGTPALLDKFTRAQMALQNGADLVFELPVLWATASAEYFAAAGVALLNALGIVDYISFGCECDTLSLLESIAQILAEEPEAFSTLLKQHLKHGANYAMAREKALTEYLATSSKCIADSPTSHFLNNHSSSDIQHVLSCPNNILAIEYLKALHLTKSKIAPLPILRQGAGYHDTNMATVFGSASGIRAHLYSLESSMLYKTEISALHSTAIQNHMPDTAATVLFKNSDSFLWENDFSSPLYYKLLSEQTSGYEAYGDCNAFLSNRIAKHLPAFCNFSDFCDLLKTKDMALTRVRRILLHILLNIHQTDYTLGKKSKYIPYLRLLGLKKDCSFLLKIIQEQSALLLINRPKKADTILNGNALAIFRKDIFASNLYYGIRSQKRQSPEKTEYEREIIRL